MGIGEYNFASSVRRIELQECLLSRASDGSIYISSCAGGAQVLYF
ncbi:hypothetical protein [Streptomyces sp. ISL-86]|nr:hypothetical protein [Streptomyces sp. ISL-86]